MWRKKRKSEYRKEQETHAFRSVIVGIPSRDAIEGFGSIMAACLEEIGDEGL